MCLPAAALGILSAAASGVGVYSQYRSARAQIALLDQQRQAQAEEIAAKRDQMIGERVAAARREAARRLVAAGEAGVGGVSAVLDIQNTFGRANQDAAVIAKQASFEDRASQVNYASELAGIYKPNILDAGLAIAGGYLAGRQLGSGLKKLTIKGGQT